MSNTYPTTISSVANLVSLASATYNAGYSSLQGYTISPDYTHYAVLIKDSIPQQEGNNNAYIIKGTGATSVSSASVSGIKPLMHANDCTYYNSKLFVAQGGYVSSDSEQQALYNSKIIKAYNSSFKKVGEYSYTGNTRNTISCIAHIDGNYFLLGTSKGYSVCQINETAKTFTEISNFSYTESQASLSRPDKENVTRKVLSQGIYCTRTKLYRVYSIKNTYTDGTYAIKWNTIAQYSFNGTFPAYNGLTQEKLYVCDKTSYNKFELESISSPNGTDFYVAGNMEDQNGLQADRIYKIIFNA